MPVREATPEELYKPIVATEATALGLPLPLVYSLIHQESRWDPKALSPKGARGLMQLMPETAKNLGVDPDDPVQNIRGGLKELKSLFDQFGDDTAKVLAGYNAGPGAVMQYGGVPPYPETQAYVQAIMGNQPAVAPAKGRIRAAKPTELPPPKPTATIGPQPTAATRLARIATPTIGAVAGGMRGAAMGAPFGPVGAFVGGVAGAGLGAGGADLLQAGWERLTGAPDAPRSGGDVVSRVATATTTGAVGEGVGRGIVPVAKAVARPLLKPFARDIEPYAAEAMSTFKRPGGASAVLPSEVSKSRTLDISENIAEGSILGGKRITGVKDTRQQIAEEKVNEVLDMLGPRVGPRQAGRSAVESRRQAIERFRGSERTEWEKFQGEVGDTPLPGTPRLDDFIAQATQKEKGAILPNAGMTAAQRVAALTGEEPLEMMIGGVQQDFRQLPASVQQALMQAGAGPPTPTLSVGQFQKTVSNLGTLTRRLERAAKIDPTKNAELGLAKKLYGLAQQDLEEAIKAVGPKAEAAYENARMVSRLGNQQFFNEELRAVVRGSPEKIVGKLLRKDNSTAVEAVQRAIGPAEFNALQSAAMEKILKPNARTGQINWGDVATRIDGLGVDTVAALFPGAHAAEVRNVAKLMLELNRKPAGGIGRLGIQFTQWGALSGIGIGLATGTAGLAAAGTAPILLGPSVLAKIFASPKGLKWLTTGLKAPQGSAAAIRAATELMAFTGRDAAMAQPEPGGPPAPTPTRAAGAGPVGAPPPRPSGPLAMSDRPSGWRDADERRFQQWYATAAAQQGLNPDPDAPEQAYNYRHAFKAGAWPDKDGHWPSEFKAANHPNRYVGGVDTVTGQPPPPPKSLVEMFGDKLQR